MASAGRRTTTLHPAWVMWCTIKKNNAPNEIDVTNNHDCIQMRKNNPWSGVRIPNTNAMTRIAKPRILKPVPGVANASARIFAGVQFTAGALSLIACPRA